MVQEVAGSPSQYTTADRWRMQGGIELSNVVVEPAPLRAGEVARISMDISGVRGEVLLRIGLRPPRAASRQVALGGVDAPTPTLPPDPRSVEQSVRLTAETTTVQVELALPEPWHPRQAIVTADFSVGQAPTETVIEATDGPRTDAGRPILGLVAVDTQPTRVPAVRATVAPSIDGQLDEACWQQEGTTLVDSLAGEPWSGKAGDVRLAWDDTYLYAAAAFADRDVWSTMLTHDDPLWKEEVFELFVFGRREAKRYLELQVSPRGVTFDAKFESYRKGQTDWDSAWKTAVQLRGTLDNRKDRDQGWSVEVAVPWAEICALTPTPCPPRPGTRVSINAFRFERPEGKATVGLALSPTRAPDFHAAANAADVELQP